MDPVQRVQDWRQQKRKAGFQAVTIWVQAEVKHRLQDLASERHQDLGEVGVCVAAERKAGKLDLDAG